ncbi:MAG: ABC transporter permease, partial [Proteobacteria bacterium]|nr:ABC transporter permease [Pseudomonadota bacterium]MBU1582458.1 ABC transporter permease [Pseudomonadota bacterium]MBU2452905.1 ABC transporter permease [Pseudomonadota bacterium]
MMFKIEPRPSPSKQMRYFSPLIAALLMLLSGLLIFTVLGKNPGIAFHAFFIEPINDFYGLGELIIKASPLMLIGVGLAIGFKANIWNIGAEGQLAMGAVFGGGIAIYFNESTSVFILPAMFAGGIIGGMFWASIPAFLKTRFNANEILVSLMLNYVAILILSLLVHGPWKDPHGYGFPQSVLFSESALLPVLIEGTRLHAGVIISFAAIGVGWIFLLKSFIGYQLQVSGLAINAAAYAGFNYKKMIWIGLLAGGLTSGIAGVSEIAGPIGQLLPSVSPGYGFAAIIVAYVGRLHPGGIFLSSLLMALLYLGGESGQMNLDLPSAVTGVF